MPCPQNKAWMEVTNISSHASLLLLSCPKILYSTGENVIKKI
jgi:hypothetical protein